jgi:hypothetical protein
VSSPVVSSRLPGCLKSSSPCRHDASRRPPCRYLVSMFTL